MGVQGMNRRSAVDKSLKTLASTARACAALALCTLLLSACGKSEPVVMEDPDAGTTGISVSLEIASTTTITWRDANGATQTETGFDPASASPLTGTLVIFFGDSGMDDPSLTNAIARQQIADGGPVKVDMPPGGYTLRVEDAGVSWCESQTVTVEAGSYADVALFCSAN